MGGRVGWGGGWVRGIALLLQILSRKRSHSMTKKKKKRKEKKKKERQNQCVMLKLLWNEKDNPAVLPLPPPPPSCTEPQHQLQTNTAFCPTHLPPVFPLLFRGKIPWLSRLVSWFYIQRYWWTHFIVLCFGQFFFFSSPQYHFHVFTLSTLAFRFTCLFICAECWCFLCMIFPWIILCVLISPFYDWRECVSECA